MHTQRGSELLAAAEQYVEYFLWRVKYVSRCISMRVHVSATVNYKRQKAFSTIAWLL